MNYEKNNITRSAFRKSYFIGASAPNPDLLFVLTQKVSKKTPHPSVS